METLKLSHDQMKPRVARFAELKPIGDLAGVANDMPADFRKAFISQTIFGLTSPTGSGARNFWDAGAVPAGTRNFGAVYVKCAPGEGASWHIHRYSYENFIALTGTWRIAWNAPDSEEYVDLDPFDMASIPPGAIRRFENVGDTEGLLLAFAYAEDHSLTDLAETILPPCEIERLEKAAGGKGPVYDRFVRPYHEAAEAVAAGETDADRAFAKDVAARVAADAGTI